MPAKLPCFKAYDIRGRVPEELNESLAFAIGQAYSAQFTPKKVAVGHDIRLSSPALAKAPATMKESRGLLATTTLAPGTNAGNRSLAHS